MEAREMRRRMELRGFKWDAQVGDVAVLAAYPLLMRARDWEELARLAEQLFGETLALERALLGRPELQAQIGLPPALQRLFARARPTPAAARVIRADFHWTNEGWRISEVNSDVPGGFAEATGFTRLMAAATPGTRPAGDPTAALVEALVRAAGADAVALTNAPGHLEDHQVVAHLAAELHKRGRAATVLSLPQLRWRAGRARLPCGAAVGAIVRFYQAEWLSELPRGHGWEALFVAGETPVANPGIAALSESKRLPLVWNDLGLALPAWRRLLPETRALADAPWARDESWLIKSAYSNTGDTVSVRGALPAAEWMHRSWRARLAPGRWLAQRRFAISPLDDEAGAIHPCIGVYVIDGRAAGAYVRLSRGPVVDFASQEAALLLYDNS
jgi:glutathionylspermidine synthase